MSQADKTASGPDRRGFMLGALGALGAFSVGGSALAKSSSNPPPHSPAGLRLDDPVGALTALIRLQGRLDGRDAPWWYFGRIYGVMPDAAPRLLVRFEGLEISRFTALPGSEYAVTGVTTSFFSDPATRQVLDTFRNPYTGVANAVIANQIGGTSAAVAVYTPAGIRPALVKAAEWQAPGLNLMWDYHGEDAWMSHERVFPPGIPQPIAEASCTRARRADLHDLQRAFVPASFSSTYVSPWPRWMQMQGQPGHTVWHADGLKFNSATDIPAEFLARMRERFPGRLAAPPYAPPAG